MTIYFPDISAFQKGISLNGAVAAAIKATEGTGWTSSDYSPAMGRARTAGCFGIGYHFLHGGSAAAQAKHCHDVVGGTPLMLDWEPTGSSRPGVGDATGFIDAYRKLGGVCNFMYLPHWYWQQIGSPGLGAFISRKMALWSSAYTTYSDNGMGWAPYGGMTPQVWQYTDSHSFNGQKVDFNAYKGSIAQFRQLAGSGQAVAPPPKPAPGAAPKFPYPAGHYLGQPSSSPYCHSGYYGGVDNTNVHTWQARMAARGWSGLSMDGQYGPQSDKTCRAFQGEKGLPVDGKVGPQTWAATWTSPVT
jgi:peptidoglycan hydrolase-like protein with peptidoglycan-binding domain